jgi:hypothetical protein
VVKLHRTFFERVGFLNHTKNFFCGLKPIQFYKVDNLSTKMGFFSFFTGFLIAFCIDIGLYSSGSQQKSQNSKVFKEKDPSHKLKRLKRVKIQKQSKFFLKNNMERSENVSFPVKGSLKSVRISLPAITECQFG